ncbi:DUF979 domain-containing protein [Clostridium mediterraneense]|uniref:DUF979 domain-containing protein n=1 Tax=Clostridium mediterraneense TaxID=1805472 RepID=UPI0008375F4F|nr:DUF979 domain-containing protein [Clostridium mediterraneense]
MDMQQVSNILLEIFYVLVGLLMLYTASRVFRDTSNKTRIGTTIFWTILGVIFIFGKLIPSAIVGGLLLVIGLLTGTKKVTIGKLVMPDPKKALDSSKKIKNKIFIPSIIIAVVALVIAQFTPISGVAAIGIASVTALIVTFFITKAKPVEALEDGDRMLQSVGQTSILPQLLAALGALFTAAGVGDVISGGISKVIPDGNILLGVIAYCVGMAVFTMIMGNAFAAFSVITVGIGVPFVFMQGGNIVVASALALTAGYCGTLMTPMAANFNVMPAALLETKDKNIIVKRQLPVALLLLVIHIVLMYVLAFKVF